MEATHLTCPLVVDCRNTSAYVCHGFHFMTSGFSELADMCFSYLDEKCFYPYFHNFTSNKVHQKKIEMYPFCNDAQF